MEFKIKLRAVKALFLITITILLFSCGNDNESVKQNQEIKKGNTPKISFNGKQITAPYNGSEFTVGDTITVKSEDRDSFKLDSVAVLLDGQLIKTYPATKNKFSVIANNINPGKHFVSVKSFYKSKDNTTSVDVFFKSDIEPVQYTAKIVKTYPHSTKHYTQGLTFDNGKFYEGTGQWGESKLLQIDLKTGETIYEHPLPAKVFGEGIVVYNDEIIQLTWQSRKAFVFNKKDLSLKNTFYYDTEGWGITNYKDNLIMSDGSNKLYIVEPNTFAVIKQIEVYDNKKAIRNLNELENINGKIYANVYLAHNIVIIDPETGKVEGNIDLTSIIPKEYLNENDNVLNGIAYDKNTGKIYITGKRWDKLFEIKVDVRP